MNHVMLRHLSVRVGSRESVGELWGKIHGPDGYGVPNDAGRDPLAFLLSNEATVTHGLKRTAYTNTPGNTRNQGCGTVLTLPSCSKVTAKVSGCHHNEMGRMPYRPPAAACKSESLVMFIISPLLE